MKYLFELLVLLLFFEISISSGEKKISFLGGVIKSSIDCYYDYTERYYHFQIPIETEGFTSEEIFNLDLNSPEGKKLECTVPRSLNEKECIYCTLDVSDFLLYQSLVSFKTEYDWNSLGYIVENWDTYFGQDGTISESANCINTNYHIFLNADKISDNCESDLHHVIAIGDYLPANNNNLNEDYSFELDIKVNSKDAKAQCKITNHDSSDNSILKELHCLFKGQNTFEVKPIIVKANNCTENFFIDEIGTFNLKECGASLLKISCLVIISLLLL